MLPNSSMSLVILIVLKHSGSDAEKRISFIFLTILSRCSSILSPRCIAIMSLSIDSSALVNSLYSFSRISLTILLVLNWLTFCKRADWFFLTSSEKKSEFSNNVIFFFLSNIFLFFSLIKVVLLINLLSYILINTQSFRFIAKLFFL